MYITLYEYVRDDDDEDGDLAAFNRRFREGYQGAGSIWKAFLITNQPFWMMAFERRFLFIGF